VRFGDLGGKPEEAYDEVQAVKGIDFAIQPGEGFGLLGPNEVSWYKCKGRLRRAAFASTAIALTKQRAYWVTITPK